MKHSHAVLRPAVNRPAFAPVGPPNPARRSAIGAIELTVAMVLSGTIGVFVLKSGAEPATAAWFRCVIGAVVMGSYCLVRGYLRNSGYTPQLVLLAAAGGAALVVNWVFLFAAYANTSIGIATTVYHVQPFLLILAAPLTFRERVTLTQTAWVALGFAGLVAIAQPWREPLTGDFMLGILQALAAAALYAVVVLIAKRITGVRPHVTVLIQTLVGAVALLPLVAWGSIGATWASGWPWLLGLGVIHTGIMYLLMYSAYPKLATPVIAVLGFVYPVAALFFDQIVFGTVLSSEQIAGIAAILVAGIAATRPARRTAAPAAADPTIGERSR